MHARPEYAAEEKSISCEWTFPKKKPHKMAACRNTLTIRPL